MTPARAAAFLLVAALLVLAGTALLGGIGPATEERADSSAGDPRKAFQARLEEAEATARCALENGPTSAESGCVPEAWIGRLEGTAVGRAPGEWIDWAGTPSDPLPVGAPDRPTWEFRSRGMRHTLVARTATRLDGRFGAAWFTLEASPDADPSSIRLPAGFLGGGRGTVTLIPSSGGSSSSAGGEVASRRVPLVAPDGTPIAILEVDPPGAGAAGARTRALGRAIAGLLAAIALVVGSTGAWRNAAVAAGIACLGGARLALLLGRSLETLLPRSVGGPSLYGAGEWAGLLGSPASFAATALAWLGLALWVRRRRTARSGAKMPERLVVTALGAAALAALVLVSAGLARDSRVDLLSLQDASASVGHSALLAGVAAAALATGLLLFECWMAWTAFGARFAMWVALLVSAGVAAECHLAERNRLAAERLQAEYAPLVVEQSARRRLALEAHVAEAAGSDLARELVAGGRRAEDPSAGWTLWSRGALGLRGWLSSIEILDADGATRAQFAFGLPPLDEPAVVDGGASVREETIAFGASERRLLHAESRVVEGDSPAGRLVAHVLDEPENLPFLPAVAPFLSALGSPASPVEGPEYVLYGDDGRVLMSTLPRPPPPNPAWFEPSGRGRVVSLRSGGSPYLAVGIRDGGRMHLLLSPSGGVLERAGALARVALLESLLLAIGVLGSTLAAGPVAWRAGGIMRGSFYRKLLAAMLAASLVPLLGLALLLRTSIARGAERNLQESSANIVGAVRRVVEDYAAVLADEEGAAPARVDDGILSWLRGLVEQEIHLYEDGVLSATSKPELFESGLLSTRLPGVVRRSLFDLGEPSVLRDEPFGGATLTVAYARADLAGSSAVLAVPLVLERREIALAMDRVLESLLLATLLLGSLLAVASAWMARAVAGPVRELVDATARVARGDYGTRLRARSRDELGSLADGFNAMAAALAAQRADLERRRDYMEALLRHATTGVVSTDADGRIVTMNPAAEGLLAAAGAQAAPGRKLDEASDRAPALRSFSRILDLPVSDRVEPEEIDVRVPDSPRRLRVVRVPLPDPLGGRAGALLLLDDVTEVARSNQLAAWAEMARAIAHEIKNPLTPIQLSTEHLERLLKDRGTLPDGDIEACLRTVLGQVRALREIAAEFSAYSKLPDLALESTDVSSFLREALAPYRTALPAGVSLDERYEPVPRCAIDRRTLGRALANLVENALHAMPDGGTIRVSTGHDERTGEVSITVADTGTGLAPEARERLFEPYFSTKSSGTGLGLAIVLRTVQSHGGRIDVESAPGGGAAFHVRLPAWR